MKKYFESGRSMVEMLGTLAIIGVLSIGGIAGYSYGMDKYRANQTINDVMLMGVDMITQLSQNRGTPTLSADWGTKTTAGYDFTVVPNPENETQYGIQITGVPSSICKMVGDGLKQTVAVYVGNEDYNSNTETDPCDESNSNTMEFYFDTGAVESDGCKTDADCGENKYCDKDTGICFNGAAPEGTHGACDTSDSCCSNGDPYSKHGDDCSTATIANGMCYYGTCIAKGCTYDENKCTGKAEYCASPNDSCEEAFPNGKTGTCVKADFTKLDVAGKTYYVSHNTMSWWDADAACKALGRDGLVGVNDLVTGWAGKGDYNIHEFTPLGAALQSHLKIGYQVWTSDDYSSCNAFKVFLSDAFVNNDSRNANYYSPGFAVCQ